MARSGYRFRFTKGGLFFLLLSAFVFMGAYNTDVNLLMLICATMLTFFGVSLAAPFRVLRKLRVRRARPAEAYAGEPFKVRLRVGNPRWFAARSIAAEDAILMGGVTVLRPRSWLDRAPGRRESTMSYLAQLPRRGVYTCRGPTLSTRFPFGLHGGARVWSDEEELLVFPPRGRLRAGMTLRVGRSRFPVGSTLRRGAGEEEFRSLREFAAGDNPRRIHWRTTARLGKPYVREMEWTRESSLLIMVDTSAPDDATDGLDRLDAALSFAVEVTRRVIQAGGVVRFAAYGPEPVVVDRVVEFRQLRSLLEAMARLAPAPERSVAQLVAEKDVGFARSGGRLAVLLDSRAEAALRRKLGSAAIETYVVGSPAFSDLFELTRPGEAEGVFRAAGSGER